MISVLLVDDHRVVRAGLAAVLNLQPDMRVVAEAADGEEAIEQCRRAAPDVIIMDLRLPRLDGWRAASAILRENPSARILVFSSLIAEEHVYRALQAGALGYLTKDAGEREITEAIRRTASGRRTLPAHVVEALDRRLATDPLSAREIDILRLVAAGRANREIGQVLGITENTVKGYLKNIAVKLDAPDRTAAAVIALQRGLIDSTQPV
jgi:two-component system NarL family response regulator